MTGEHGVGPVVRTADVASARAARDEQTGEPIVLVTFTPTGSARCHDLLRAVAHAGARAGRPYHIAIRVDGRVVTRPYVDYHLLPEGGTCNQGVEINGLPSSTAAKELATKLRGG
jgi:preprotein translocase subunit SecD